MTSRRRAAAGLAVVGCGVAVGPLDTAVNISFPAMTAAFQMPIENVRWIIICYVLTYSSLMLVAGKLGDRFGRRRIFMAGLAVSCVGLLACAAAPSFELLLAARVVQGLGTALAIACGPALATALYDEQARPRIVGYYAAMFAAAGALGPVIGGGLIDAFGWQAVFWFRIPLALTVLAFAWLLPRDDARAGATSPFDIAGAVTIVILLASLAGALNLARDGAVSDVAVAVLFTLAAAYAFVLAERAAADPVIRLKYFREPRFTLLNILNIVICGASFTPYLFTPFYLTRIAGFDTAVAGLALAASGVGTTVAAAAAGRLAQRGYGRFLVIGGAWVGAAGMILVADTASDSGLLYVLGSLALAGAGLGVFQAAYLDGVTEILPQTERGVAGGLAMATRTMGVIAAVSVFTMLFTELQFGEDTAESFMRAYRHVYGYAAVALGLAGGLAAAMLVLVRE